MFNKKTIKDINLAGKRVLLRADYNVTISDERVIDDYRITESVETIQHILHTGAKALIIISHLGRPRTFTGSSHNQIADYSHLEKVRGKPESGADKNLSLAPVAKKLSGLLGKEVGFVGDCVGPTVKSAAANLPESGILLLENLRFHDGEEKNDPSFAKALVEASGAEVFVQDGFGVAHRAHASTEAITKLLPSVAGLLLEKEVVTINQVIGQPKRPFSAIIGGAKIPDKIDVLGKLIETADCVAVGGALANDFLRAQQIKIGTSQVDEASQDLAKELLNKALQAEKARAFNFLTPVDVVVSQTADGKSPLRIVDLAANIIASLQNYPKKPEHQSFTVNNDEKILDIGPVTAGIFAGAIKMSKTVVWCGTMGVTETKGLAGADDPFAHGTKAIVEAMIGTSNAHANKPYSLVGGGDTVGFVEATGQIADFNHVSTGGTASLELIAGHSLPAVEALLDK